MISGKLVWLIAIQFAIFKGSCCSNSTQTTTEKLVVNLNSTLPTTKTSFSNESISSTEANRQTPELSSVGNTTLNEPSLVNSTSVNQTQLEIIEIFRVNSSSNGSATNSGEQSNVTDTLITKCLNEGSENLTCIEQWWNDTLKTNYSVMAESIAHSEDTPAFRLSNSAAIAAGVFLISSVLGYISCIGYRRFLQRKYGNSQILIGEEVYDTTDLRNFEI